MDELFQVTAFNLNVRAVPSLNGAVIGFLQRGEVVRLLAKSQDRYWFRIVTRSGRDGWASHKFLASVKPGPPSHPDDPPWLRVGREEIGVKEYAHMSDNPRIVEYHRTTTLGPQLASQDETPWCSSFVNWCFEECYFEGTDSAAARSWLGWGVVLQAPRPGCVTVFSRPPSPTSGHVGFYMGESADSILVLGGNQSNAVNVSAYPKARLLGFRWPGNA